MEIDYQDKDLIAIWRSTPDYESTDYDIRRGLYKKQ